MKSALHSFFVWLKRREGIPMPEFPVTPFTLGLKKIIDKGTQTAIIEEIYRISHHINPKIWLGIKWLTSYISIRRLWLLRI